MTIVHHVCCRAAPREGLVSRGVSLQCCQDNREGILEEEENTGESPRRREHVRVVFRPACPRVREGGAVSGGGGGGAEED